MMNDKPSYWILIWDGWGNGLNMINPRIYSENGNNWFSCAEDEVEFWGETVLPKHDIPNPELKP